MKFALDGELESVIINRLVPVHLHNSCSITVFALLCENHGFGWMIMLHLRTCDLNSKLTCLMKCEFFLWKGIMVKKRKLASSPPPPSENDWIGLPLPLSSKSIQTVRALHTYTYVHTYSDIVQCLITLCKDISVPFFVSYCWCVVCDEMAH